MGNDMSESASGDNPPRAKTRQNSGEQGARERWGMAEGGKDDAHRTARGQNQWTG